MAYSLIVVNSLILGLSADDILAKYQRSSPNGELAQVMNVNDEMAVGTDASNDQQPPAKSHQEEVPYYNPTDLVHCRYVALVLSLLCLTTLNG